MLLNIFKTRKNKQFTYSPRFYDQRKEELEQRIKAVEREMQGNTGEIYSNRLTRGAFRQRRERLQKQTRNSYIRLVVILLVLALVIYLIYIFS